MTTTPTRVMIRKVRLAFPNLFNPTTVNGEGKPRYSATLIFPPDHEAVPLIKAAILAAATAKWAAKAQATVTALEKSGKLALHDGDEKSNYDGFEGNLFVTAASREDSPPGVYDADKTPLTERSGKIYAGCYVNASVDFWAQDNAFGKRVNAQLRGVQFAADGDAFSAGRPASADEFEAVEGADADDF